ncbi:cupin domain-containing protein [Acidicapsa dinghuensis]|uniref:Cupin domain-containing protein n=1 Tax=Acidicapsa dinghuensis TaxID=2218256 RepID=A0ABW1EKH8_9BACT|nr:cupin domain-containing protein [Acidicapsa dinghuensis]
MSDVPASSPEPGLERQVLASNERMMLVRHQMQPGWVGARHSHPYDQLVYIVRGRLLFTVGDVEFETLPGDSFLVPGTVEHQAKALEESEVLDVFSPFREDYATP